MRALPYIRTQRRYADDCYCHSVGAITTVYIIMNWLATHTHTRTRTRRLSLAYSILSIMCMPFKVYMFRQLILGAVTHARAFKRSKDQQIKTYRDTHIRKPWPYINTYICMLIFTTPFQINCFQMFDYFSAQCKYMVIWSIWVHRKKNARRKMQ